MKKKIRGFTLIECIVGLAIIGILAAFIIPSLISSLQLDIKTNEDKEMLDYSKHIVESIKTDIYNGKNIYVENDFNKGIDFNYNLEKLGDLNKLVVNIWRVENEEEIFSYEVLLPEKD